jgi:phosphate starvation-inducible PhoH-like protein
LIRPTIHPRSQEERHHLTRYQRTDEAGAETGERVLEFDDNRLLIELFGPADRNLAILENGLDVSIARRGNQVVVLGAGEGASMAEAALDQLYERLQQGRPVARGDVEALVRTGRLPDQPAALADATPAPDQLDMFPGGRVEIRTRRKLIQPRTKAQAAYVRQLFSKDLTFGVGPAGTGKTYLAVAAAVSMFIENRVERIILSRPAVEAGERLGFLPGDMKEKIDPYLRPLYDALEDMLPPKSVPKLIEERKIEVAPLAFMRGRTLSRAFVVLDEAQNTTSMQMRMFLTRLGEDSRMAVTGDPSQVDLPPRETSGLVEALRVLEGVDEIGFARFAPSDVQRNPIVERVIRAYDAAGKTMP